MQNINDFDKHRKLVNEVRAEPEKSDRMKKVVLLRHGESVWNRENRFTGWTDVDLSEKGVAEAVKAGFDLIRDHTQAAASAPGTTNAAGDRAIIVATVQGDIHDIGKNIVKMLLENYGFTVIDLGRDVAPEAVLAAARDTRARLIGLSALMTTTVGAMERTIQLIHEQLPGTAVMVGGAVITQEFADQIGADFYAKDAAASTRVASAFFDD